MGPKHYPSPSPTGCADQLSPVFTDIFNTSLETCHMPSSFKSSTVIPVPPKKRRTEDYRLVALSFLVRKSFECLVLSHLKSITDPLLDPLKFAYRANRSVDNAMMALDLLQVRQLPFTPGPEHWHLCKGVCFFMPSSAKTMTTATSPILLKWDPKSLEIRTLTVERLLEPLVTQVTTLVNTSNKGPSSKKKGRSKKAHVLAVSVEQATQNFLEKGEQIAKDSQDLKEELIAAVEDVRKQGETMRIASSEFADDPCSSVKRGTMVRAARALLSAVTRLLILADMADVMRLLAHLKIELKDPQCRDEMAAARGALKKNATMLYTASQAFLRHPDVAATRANRDYVFKQVQEAIGGISSAAQATSPTDEKHGHAGIGELAAALNEFDVIKILKPPG
eukprot:superscaffoldBa00000052_g894